MAEIDSRSALCSGAPPPLLKACCLSGMQSTSMGRTEEGPELACCSHYNATLGAGAC